MAVPRTARPAAAPLNSRKGLFPAIIQVANQAGQAIPISARPVMAGPVAVPATRMAERTVPPATAPVAISRKRRLRRTGAAVWPPHRTKAPQPTVV